DPLRYGWFSVGLATNKILRRLLPLCLAGLFASSLVLSFRSPVFLAASLAQAALYLLAASSRLMGNSGPFSPLRKAASMACYFTAGQCGTFLGVMDFLRRRSVAKWDPLKTDVQSASSRPPASRDVSRPLDSVKA